jgi:23S rRNA (uracil1939-C5)-methyltransferase
VELACVNAARNNLTQRTSFETANVGAVLAERLTGCDALFVDPPRRGLEPQALEALLSHGPPLILYLSCDAATLARDLGLLVGEAGYRVAWLQPLDFFPNTTHIETLAVLRR